MRFRSLLILAAMMALAVTCRTGAREAPSGIVCVSNSPNGAIVASANLDGVVRLHDAATGKVVHELNGHDSNVNAVAFAPDGKTLATGSGDQTIRIWDVAKGKVLRVLSCGKKKGSSPPLATVLGLSFSSDGKLLAAITHDRRIRVWDVAAEKIVQIHKGVNAGAFWDEMKQDRVRTFVGVNVATAMMTWGPNGGPLYWAQGTSVCSADPARGDAEHFADHESPVIAVALTPDGKTIVTSARNKTLCFWDVATKKETKLILLPRPASMLAFAPDGKTLAWLDDGHGAHLMEMAGEQEVLVKKGFNCVAFSLDGKTLVGAEGDRLRLESVVETLPPQQLTREQWLSVWDDLRGSDAKRAFAALAKIRASADAASFLQAQLAKLTVPDTRQVAQWIADLESDEHDTRTRATEALIAMHDTARPALRKFLEGNPSRDAKRRAEAILERMDDIVSSPDVLAGRRAVMILELMNDPESRQALQAVAEKTGVPWLKADIEASLSRRKK